jgi:predicted dehydrogenase
MLDAAKTSGAALTPLYAARACPQYGCVATQVASGTIGDVGFIRVVRHASSGPTLHALAADIDWIAATFGRIDTVFAQIVRKSPIDTTMLTFTLSKGPIVQCVASVSSTEPRGDIELCAVSGMIQFSVSEPILRLSSRSPRSAQISVASSPLHPPIEVRRLRLFFDAIDAGRFPAAQLKHELHVVRVVEAALKSNSSGRAVKVFR